MGILDSEHISDNLDRIVPARKELHDVMKGKISSALVVDKDNLLSFITECTFGDDILIKYIDLADCKEGDYEHIANALSSPQFDGWEGIMFDNIDLIPDISDKEYLEELVRFALKRDVDFPFTGNPSLDFSSLLIGAKCRQYPDYLKGKSLQTIIINI